MARQRSRTQESPERTSRLAKHSSGKRLPPPTPTQVVERSGAVRSLMANHRLKKSIKIPSHGEQGICSVRLLSVSLVSCSRVCVGPPREKQRMETDGGPRSRTPTLHASLLSGGRARTTARASRASERAEPDGSINLFRGTERDTSGKQKLAICTTRHPCHVSLGFNSPCSLWW